MGAENGTDLSQHILRFVDIKLSKFCMQPWQNLRKYNVTTLQAILSEQWKWASDYGIERQMAYSVVLSSELSSYLRSFSAIKSSKLV